MAYGLILRRSIEIAWRHKWLWLLAFFAAETGGSTPSYNFGNVGNLGGRSSSAGSPGSVQAPDLRPLTDFISTYLGLLVVIAVVVVVIWIALFLFSCVCAGAVVRSVDAIDRDEELGLGRAFGLGMQRFGVVLRLRLLFLLFGIGVLVVIGIVGGLFALAIIVKAYVAVALLVILAGDLAVAFFALAVAYPVFTRLALRAVALESVGAWASLGSTVSLMRRRIGPVIVLWAIELAIGIGVGIVLFVFALSLVVPGAIAGYAAFTTGSPAAVTLAATLLVFAVGLLLLLGAALSAFYSSYWTLGFRQLQRA